MTDLPTSAQIDTNDNTPQNENLRKRGFTSWLHNFIFGNKNDTSLREAIEELIEEEENEESSFATHERTLISNILELRDLPVVEIMVPRADILAIDITTPQKELLSLLAEKPHTRLPVIQDDLDNVIGAVHMKDVVAHMQRNSNFELKDIMRDVLIVSPAMQVLDLLLQMRQSRLHIAMVVDEFGGIDGLITINDLIEAVVGEIEDEHALEIQPQLIERPDGTILADARFPMEEFEERFNIKFSEEEHEDADTLGGLVNVTAGHVPSRGEIIKHESGIEFIVLDADPRRINRLKIKKLSK